MNCTSIIPCLKEYFSLKITHTIVSFFNETLSYLYITLLYAYHEDVMIVGQVWFDRTKSLYW